MRVPLLDLNVQLQPLRDEIVERVTELIDSTGYILGDKVSTFENDVASYCQTKHARVDADVLIVKTAIASASTANTVLVGDDTDLLILLCYHAPLDSSHEIFQA